jgi:hypothetical protein
MAFVNQAKYVRRNHTSMSYVSAQLVKLSLPATSHVADVFDFSPAAGRWVAQNPAVAVRMKTALVHAYRLRRRGTEFLGTSHASRLKCVGLRWSKTHLGHRATCFFCKRMNLSGQTPEQGVKDGRQSAISSSPNIWTSPCLQELTGGVSTMIDCSNISGLLMRLVGAGPDDFRSWGPRNFDGV